MFSKLKKTEESRDINTTHLIIFSVFFVVVLGTYPLWMNLLDEQSSYFYFYINENYPNTWVYLSIIARLISSMMTQLVLTVLIFNFSNLLKLVITNTLFFIAMGLSALLKLIYLKEPLYLVSQKFNNQYYDPQSCIYTWAAPVMPSVYFSSMSLCFWYLFVPKNSYRILTISLGVLLLFGANFCIFSLGVYSISDILISIFIGLMLFYLFFYIMNLDPENSSDIKILLNNKLIIALINMALTLVIIMLYFFNKKNEKDTENIMLRISMTECYFQNPLYFDYSLDSIILLCFFTSNLAMILGIHLEKKLFSEDGSYKWNYFNFKNDKNDLESIYSLTVDLKSSQWNDTPITQTIFRVIISFIVLIATFVIIHFIPFHDDKLGFTVIIKYFLPFFLYVFFIYFLLKWTFIKLKLVNKMYIEKDDTTNTEVEHNLQSLDNISNY